MVSIPAFQAGGPGSIPGQRNYRAISLAVMIPRCQRGGPGSTPGWRSFFNIGIIFCVQRTDIICDIRALCKKSK